MSKLEYKTIYKPVQFRPEFLDRYAKRQAELLMQIQKIDDDIAMEKIKAQYRPMYIASLMPVIIVIGGIGGAIVGLLIVSQL